MRFAVRLSFNGNNYFGWQSQDSENTIQDKIEQALKQRYNTRIDITGCCRTDSGVHASEFVFHFDYHEDLRDGFIYSLNKMLPNQIALHRIFQVPDDFHCRFDAISRSYIYNLHVIKNPFKSGFSFYFPALVKADFELISKAAEIIKKHREFYPFCKAHTDVKTMKCNIHQIKWTSSADGQDYSLNITSDRFLRGMVRLIVGACINIGLGKTSLEELELALQNQNRLEKSWSVPPHGLFLNEIKYLTLD
jgi:tRNA pseudouridine38-40 synthase